MSEIDGAFPKELRRMANGFSRQNSLRTALEMAADEIEDLRTALLTQAERGREDEAIKALERLASMEAFDTARMVDPWRDAELLARIEFADKTVRALKHSGRESGERKDNANK